MAVMYHRHNHPILITASKYMLKSLEALNKQEENEKKAIQRKRKLRNIFAMAHISAKFEGIQEKRFVGLAKDERDKL